MLTWYMLFPFFIVGFLKKSGRGIAVACVLTFFGILIVISIGMAGGTDLYRHRITLFPLMFLLAGGGYQNDLSPKYRWVFYVWWIGAGVFTLIYLVARGIGVE